MVPIAQVLGSYRSRDRGWPAHPTDSGYERVLLSPGLELDFKRARVYGDIEFPVYQRMNGHQLVASALYKLIVSYDF